MRLIYWCRSPSLMTRHYFLSHVSQLFPQIVTAVKFLNNPNVVRSAITKKQAFLRSKGLSEDEIQIACERAGVFTTSPTQQTVISMGVESSGGGNYAKPGYQIQPRQNFLTRMKDMLSSVALLSGLMYGVYLFYKVFKSRRRVPASFG